MKINVVKSYLSKLSTLALKFHEGKADHKDLIHLGLLISAFQVYLKTNEVSPDLVNDLTEISNLS